MRRHKVKNKNSQRPMLSTTTASNFWAAKLAPKITGSTPTVAPRPIKNRTIFQISSPNTVAKNQNIHKNNGDLVKKSSELSKNEDLFPVEEFRTLKRKEGRETWLKNVANFRQ